MLKESRASWRPRCCSTYRSPETKAPCLKRLQKNSIRYYLQSPERCDTCVVPSWFFCIFYLFWCLWRAVYFISIPSEEASPSESGPGFDLTASKRWKCDVSGECYQERYTFLPGPARWLIPSHWSPSAPPPPTAREGLEKCIIWILKTYFFSSYRTTHRNATASSETKQSKLRRGAFVLWRAFLRWVSCCWRGRASLLRDEITCL